MTIGERIKQRRIELGLSQEELSKKMGYKTRNAIYQFEQKSNMKLSLVEKFAKVLDTTPAYLMGWGEGVTVSGHDSEVITVDFTNAPEPSKEEIDKALNLLKRFESLPPEKQTALLTLLEVPQNDV